MCEKYRPIPPQADLPAMEQDVLRFWDSNDIFHRSLAQTAAGPRWISYEGPPTANGSPGTHHVEARAFKDVFPRFKTMQGYWVPRKAGWDCHGLPVELAIEKELGFTAKKDIEAYGIAKFNERCRESVLRHVGEFNAMTRRMGYWLDTDDAYWTMDPAYVQSVWWSLKQIFDAGLLSEDHRVAPYCPRCGTGLSDHELAQGYETIVDPSVYVRFPVTDTALAQRYPGLAMLVWTTTPWTLVSNTAVAVKPDAAYVVARSAAGEVLLVAQALATAILGQDYSVLETMQGRQLERVSYSRPFDLVDIPQAHFVVLGEYVTTQDGTGLVHLAPAFGADDLTVCREYGLPVVNPIRPDGTFAEDVPLVGGVFFKTADADLVADLDLRGLLFARRDYEHSYPHCWRCHTPLLYYAQPSWYIRTTAIVDKLMIANEGTNWFPETIKWGRYGDWLRNNVDWALSRNRYWGTPLPIWRCDAGHLTCIGSLAELSELAGVDCSQLDPHRPFVDDVTFGCPGSGQDSCEHIATRVAQVIDVWYDSGAMPFAQWGYPHQNEDNFVANYPADFICEAIDQTRGWFYTLMTVGTLVFDESAYRNVLCLGHILDTEGRKMSKHVGNVLEPMSLMDQHGADAVRWFMLAAGSPWQARRVGHDNIGEVVRKVLLTYWNTASFLSLYGGIAEFDASTATPPPVGRRPAIDRWALSEANRLVAGVEAALEQFDTQQAGRQIAAYIDDLSNWYVRRSRRRFWDGDIGGLATLDECLKLLTLTMAPFTPFITERIWSDLFATSVDAPESVHLASWPKPDTSLIDDTLRDNMALVRQLVELGRAARASSKIKTRQPLRRAVVGSAGWDALDDDLRREIADEINVLSLEPLSSQGADLVEVTAKANFASLGKRYAKNTPNVANAIADADASELKGALRDGATAKVVVNGEQFTIEAEDVVFTESPRHGWAVARESGATLALDLTMDDELRELGTAREVARAIQGARKDAGLDVTDRISLTWSGSPEVAAAVRAHRQTIADEVLATTFVEGDPGADCVDLVDLGIKFAIARQSHQVQRS